MSHDPDENGGSVLAVAIIVIAVEIMLVVGFLVPWHTF